MSDSHHAQDLTRRRFLTGAAAAIGGATVASVVGPLAVAGAAPKSDSDDFDADVALEWFSLLGTLVRTTPGFSPPVAARALGHAGIALYESVVPGSRRYRSLQPVLPGLGPLPTDRRKLLWPAVANATLAGIARSFFPTTSADNKAAIDALEARFVRRLGRGERSGVMARAEERGRLVAQAIFDWSTGDGGHEGYLRNFPPDYVPPVGPGLWVPTPPGFQPALQPFWGQNRCVAIADGAAVVPGDHPPYSTDPASAFLAEAIEVYDTVNNRSAEQEAIARFWSDDPGATVTPPGHSCAIAAQVVDKENASLMRAGEAFAKLGIAVNDAFIACWNAKYVYNLLRPVTYLQANVDAGWLPILTTPPFPEYPSGHSVQSGAAFRVLADLFGDDYRFVDRTHDDRGLPRRRFTSFTAAADEAGISRLYGGIHYRAAIELGLVQGRTIGAAVSALPFAA